MKIEMFVEKIEAGYAAYAVGYPTYVEGKTLAQLKANLLKAIGPLVEKDGGVIAEAEVKMRLDILQFNEFYWQR
jgi:hypothetical protein